MNQMKRLANNEDCVIKIECPISPEELKDLSLRSSYE